MISNLHTVTLTTANGHQFTYIMNPVTVANALVRLEQSQLQADKKAAREAGTTPPSAADGAVEP